MLDSPDALLAVGVLVGANCAAIRLSTASISSWDRLAMAVLNDSVTSVGGSCAGASSGFASILRLKVT